MNPCTRIINMLILMTSLGVLYWSCYQLKLPGRLIESGKSRCINSVLVYIYWSWFNFIISTMKIDKTEKFWVLSSDSLFRFFENLKLTLFSRNRKAIYHYVKIHKAHAFFTSSEICPSSDRLCHLPGKRFSIVII